MLYARGFPPLLVSLTATAAGFSVQASLLAKSALHQIIKGHEVRVGIDNVVVGKCNANKDKLVMERTLPPDPAFRGTKAFRRASAILLRGLP